MFAAIFRLFIAAIYRLLLHDRKCIKSPFECTTTLGRNFSF